MKNITTKEVDEKIKKVASKNELIKRIVRDSFDGRYEGLILKWPTASKRSLLKIIGVEENYPGMFREIK